MRARTPVVPPSLPVVDGSTAFPADGGGAQCWSSVLNVRMEWTGTRWRVASVPGSLNAVAAGDTYVIPANHNLLVSGSIVVDGVLVLDGNLIPVT